MSSGLKHTLCQIRHRLRHEVDGPSEKSPLFQHRVELFLALSGDAIVVTALPRWGVFTGALYEAVTPQPVKGRV